MRVEKNVLEPIHTDAEFVLVNLFVKNFTVMGAADGGSHAVPTLCVCVSVSLSVSVCLSV